MARRQSFFGRLGNLIKQIVVGKPEPVREAPKPTPKPQPKRTPTSPSGPRRLDTSHSVGAVDKRWGVLKGEPVYDTDIKNLANYTQSVKWYLRPGGRPAHTGRKTSSKGTRYDVHYQARDSNYFGDKIKGYSDRPGDRTVRMRITEGDPEVVGRTIDIELETDLDMIDEYASQDEFDQEWMDRVSP